jgi:hypothetical protein
VDDETKAAQMKSLTRILHASSQLDHVGYCQGMNYVAAFLLLEVKVSTSSQHVAENLRHGCCYLTCLISCSLALLFFALSIQDEFEAFSIFRFLLKQIGGFYREQGFIFFAFR